MDQAGVENPCSGYTGVCRKPSYEDAGAMIQARVCIVPAV